MQTKEIPYKTAECAEWTKPCPKHIGLYHYKCGECGVDCTIGTPDGPPTTESDGITRCYKCNHKVERFWAVGKGAILAKTAPEMLAALKQLSILINAGADFRLGPKGRHSTLPESLEKLIAKAEGL